MPSEIERMASRAIHVDLEDIPTLQLDDISRESEDMLIARGAAYVAEWARIVDRPAMLAKNTAVVMLALRIKLDDPLGRSGTYKQVVRELYSRAGVPRDKLENVQAAVRWHVGNLVRRHYTPRQLESLNLLPTSPLERTQDARKAAAHIVAATRAAQAVESSSPRASTKGAQAAAIPEQATGERIKATADNLRLAQTVATILSEINTTTVDRDMTDGQRAKLDAELEAMQKRIAQLRRHTRKPRSQG